MFTKTPSPTSKKLGFEHESSKLYLRYNLFTMGVSFLNTVPFIPNTPLQALSDPPKLGGGGGLWRGGSSIIFLARKIPFQEFLRDF